MNAPKLSALGVARVRAAHQLLDTPLVFGDSLALTILGADEEAALRADPHRYDAPHLRALRAALVVRSRVAEDAWADARRRGVRQYVILGAGLDTYAYRHADDDDSRIFELDFPATQRWKRDALGAAGIAEPPSLTFVPHDFERAALGDALAAAGFRADAPAQLSWLGVTMYLDEDAIRGTLRFAGALPRGSGIVFDYGVLPSLLPSDVRARLASLAAATAEYGEPWKTYVDPAVLTATLRTLGFSAVEDLGPEELNARYLAGRGDGLRASGASRVIRATV